MASCLRRILQSGWRGWSAGSHKARILQDEWDRRMADVARVSAALLAQGVVLAPPLAVLRPLLRSFLFFSRYHRDGLEGRAAAMCSLLNDSVVAGTTADNNFAALATAPAGSPDRGVWQYQVPLYVPVSVPVPVPVNVR